MSDGARGMDEMDGILARNGLRLVFEPADANPAMPNPAEGMAHFTARVIGAEAAFSFPVSVLREDGSASPPTPGEALALLAADIRACAPDEPDDEWLASVGGEADPDAWLAAREALAGIASAARALPAEVREALAPEGLGLSPAP